MRVSLLLRMSSMSARRLFHLDCPKRRFGWRCSVRNCAAVGVRICVFVHAACRAGITAWFTSLKVSSTAQCTAVNWKMYAVAVEPPVNTSSRPAFWTPHANAQTVEATTAICTPAFCIASHGRLRKEPRLCKPLLVENSQNLGFQMPGTVTHLPSAANHSDTITLATQESEYPCGLAGVLAHSQMGSDTFTLAKVTDLPSPTLATI